MRRLTLPACLLFCAVPLPFTCSPSLVEASTSSTVTGATVAGGLFHTCVIVADLSLRCFGGGNSDEVALLAPTGSVAAGFDNFGQLGTGNNETLGDEEGEMGDNLPEIDLGGSTVQDVSAGQSHTCALLTSGELTCFGFNLYGQLGLGDTNPRGLEPGDMGSGLALVDLGENRTATRISCGQHNTCAILENGDLKCWGSNEFGMLGVGDTVDRGKAAGQMGDALPAVDLGSGQTALAVDGGRYHTCAVLGTGGLKCWGGTNETGHNYGQLGQGNAFDILSPSDVPEIDLGAGRTVVALACGWFHTCVILDNAKLHCFGRNHDGQLGLGDTLDRGDEPGEMGDAMVAVDLGTGRHPVAVTAGRWHTCVLLDNEDVKCFGVNTADDLGAGQLGLEDADNRGMTPDTMGDGLEPVDLGIGRTASWLFSAFDHNCVIFSDSTMKCWGLNKSGQLGIGDTDDRGDTENSMGASLPVTDPGMRLATPSPSSLDVSAGDDSGGGDDGGDGLSTEVEIVVYLLGAGGAVFLLGAFCLCFRRRLEKEHRSNNGKTMDPVEGDGNDGGDDRLENGTRRTFEIGATGSTSMSMSASKTEDRVTDAGAGAGAGATPSQKAQTETERLQQQLTIYPAGRGEQASKHEDENRHGQSERSLISGAEARMAAAGTAGVAIAGGMAAGWNVIGVVAENLPWIGVAYHMLNEIADIVDTKNAMQGNMEKIKGWAVSLQDVLLQMAKQMQTRPAVNARALEHMSTDVIGNLQDLVDAVASYNAKGTLAQYAASRSCQKTIDAADTALRGALVKLSVGQGAELIAMVGRLEGVGLVVDEKLDMIIERLRKQEENAARLELRLAEYSENMAEVLGQFARNSGNANGGGGKEEQLSHAGKTLRELGKEQLDKLQISKEDISYPTKMPFASGTYSEVYQVIHEGGIKAAKKTNLARLGLGAKDVHRVFGRFVKELYILSQMHSDRVVSVYGAIASPTELTLVMEYVERGSIRSVLDDDSQRKDMTPAVQHGLLVDTAAGMQYLYKNGVEHRDLKSANCLVTHDWRVKITDFGLSNTNDAICTGSDSTMSSNFRVGTMVYMAPELLPGGAGREVPAELSDIYSYGIVVWDIVCGAGEAPWAGVSMNELPLTLKMGSRLEIPDHCGRFYRKLMLNCWRQDPHRRPNFERVLHAIKKEAASPLISATPALSPPTESAGVQESAGVEGGFLGPPAQVQQAMPSGGSPTIWEEGSGPLPTGGAAPRITRHSSAPTQKDAEPEHSVEPPRIVRRDTAPTPTSRAPRDKNKGRDSEKAGPSPPRALARMASARTLVEAVDMGTEAKPRASSRKKSAELGELPAPGDASSRDGFANSAEGPSSLSSATASTAVTVHRSVRSAESLTPQSISKLTPTRSDDPSALVGWTGLTTTPPKPPADARTVVLPAASGSRAPAVTGRSTKRDSHGAEVGHDEGRGVRPDDILPDGPLALVEARTLSLASGIDLGSSGGAGDVPASSGRSASLNVKVRDETRRAKGQDSIWTKTTATSRRGGKGAHKAQAAAVGTPGRTAARPAWEGRKSRQPETPPSREVKVTRAREMSSGGGSGGSGPEPAAAIEADAGRGGRKGKGDIKTGGGGGRERNGERRGRPKSPKVQVLHGFRLTTPAGDGAEASASSKFRASAARLGSRGREKQLPVP